MQILRRPLESYGRTEKKERVKAYFFLRPPSLGSGEGAVSYGEYGEEARRGGGATSGFEPDLTAHEAIVTTITPYRFGTLYFINTNKETRTLKGLFPLLLKRRLFTKFQHVRCVFSFLGAKRN